MCSFLEIHMIFKIENFLNFIHTQRDKIMELLPLLTLLVGFVSGAVGILILQNLRSSPRHDLEGQNSDSTAKIMKKFNEIFSQALPWLCGTRKSMDLPKNAANNTNDEAVLNKVKCERKTNYKFDLQFHIILLRVFFFRIEPKTIKIY